MVRTTSDHVPFLVTATSTASVSHVFHYERSWATNEVYRGLVQDVWGAAVNQVQGAPSRLTKKLKLAQAGSKKWARKRKHLGGIVSACKQVITLMDVVEELWPLSQAKLLLRDLVQDQLSEQHKALAIY